jgi:hypothetical protein
MDNIISPDDILFFRDRDCPPIEGLYLLAIEKLPVKWFIE